MGRLSIRKIRQVLRLKFDVGLSLGKIAASLHDSGLLRRYVEIKVFFGDAVIGTVLVDTLKRLIDFAGQRGIAFTQADPGSRPEYFR